MASVTPERVQLWDLAASREGDKELATLRLDLGAPALFDPKDGSLITDSRKMGLERWPIALDPQTDELRIGPPQTIGLSARAPLPLGPQPQFTLSSDGRTIAHSPQCCQILLFDLENPRPRLVIESPNLRHAAFSPDGQWLATGNWQGRGAKVWNARTGELVRELELGESEEGAAWPTFSPDGKWLVTGTFEEYGFWEVGSWHKKHAVVRADAARSTGLNVFSPDGRMLALRYSVSEVRLVDPETGREFARLLAAGCPYCFSPDGSQLITYAGRERAIQVWDLRLIRRELAELGLDWDVPAFPPPTADNYKPLHAKVLPSEPLPPSKELDAEAYVERGFLRLQLRQYFSAVADFKQASTLDPMRSPWDAVLAAYAKVIERNPRDAEAYRWRAVIHELLGQWQEAIDDYSRAIDRAPQSPEYVARRAMNYLQLGQNDKAAADFCKAVCQNPDQANTLARLFATSSNASYRLPNLAVELASQATRQAPGQAMYWNTLGVAYYRSGEWKTAIRALEESQKLEPDKNLGFNALILAMCHHELGDPLKAKDYYDRAVRWCDERQAKLSAQQQQELKAFRTELEALIKAPPR
jgi:tetratricopeptide (TPR) repeat protein